VQSVGGLALSKKKLPRKGPFLNFSKSGPRFGRGFPKNPSRIPECFQENGRFSAFPVPGGKGRKRPNFPKKTSSRGGVLLGSLFGFGGPFSSFWGPWPKSWKKSLRTRKLTPPGPDPDPRGQILTPQPGSWTPSQEGPDPVLEVRIRSRGQILAQEGPDLGPGPDLTPPGSDLAVQDRSLTDPDRQT